ncbi:MAG: motif putative anchor domain protein [Caulobacteraceae bacterium]|nr:motif putative anchor domain protein [Caulobacteraceae bacterium]
MRLFRALAGAAVLLSMSAASAALAGPIPYPTPGVPNPVIYTFTAASTGDIIAYFAGSGASYDEQVGMLVNGVSTGVVGLDDHTSAVGDSLDLGSVTAGDVITFVDYVFTTGDTWYSNPALNGGNGNHVYSTNATANQVYAGSPAGTYVGFEDLRFPNSDYNYFDDTFIFTNTVTSSNVPEPVTWALMLFGMGGIGGALRRQTRRAVAAA